MGGDTLRQVFSPRKGQGSGSWAAGQKWGSGYEETSPAEALETGQGPRPEKQRGSKERREPQELVRDITREPRPAQESLDTEPCKIGVKENY